MTKRELRRAIRAYNKQIALLSDQLRSEILYPDTPDKSYRIAQGIEFFTKARDQLIEDYGNIN